MALEITDARFDVVIASSSLFPAVAARGAAMAALAALMAAASAAALMIELAAAEATAAVVVTLVSDATAMLTRGQQYAADGGLVGDDESAAITKLEAL